MSPFLIVRHPFTRLVSAYEDKMLNPRPKLEFHKNVQEQIRNARKEPESFSIEFPEYLLRKEKYQIMLRRKVSLLQST